MWPCRGQFRHLTFHRNINKRESGPAKSLVFAEHQCKVAADVSLGQCDGTENLGLNIFENVRAGNKANPNIGGYEPPPREQASRV